MISKDVELCWILLPVRNIADLLALIPTCKPTNHMERPFTPVEIKAIVHVFSKTTYVIIFHLRNITSMIDFHVLLLSFSDLGVLSLTGEDALDCLWIAYNLGSLTYKRAGRSTCRIQMGFAPEVVWGRWPHSCIQFGQSNRKKFLFEFDGDKFLIIVTIRTTQL